LGDAFGGRLTPHSGSIEHLFAQVKSAPARLFSGANETHDAPFAP